MPGGSRRLLQKFFARRDRLPPRCNKREPRAASQERSPVQCIRRRPRACPTWGRNQAEKMERVGLIRLDSENLPVDLLGGLQTAASMVLNRNRQKFKVVTIHPQDKRLACLLSSGRKQVKNVTPCCRARRGRLYPRQSARRARLPRSSIQACRHSLPIPCAASTRLPSHRRIENPTSRKSELPPDWFSRH